jgi:hypothetical protein
VKVIVPLVVAGGVVEEPLLLAGRLAQDGGKASGSAALVLHPAPLPIERVAELPLRRIFLLGSGGG